MKQCFILLVFLFLLGSLGADVTLMHEDFESGSLPTGWSFTSFTYTTWQLLSPGYNSNYGAQVTCEEPSTMDLVIIGSPAIDISAATDSVRFSAMFYKNWHFGMSSNLYDMEYSFDGSNWMQFSSNSMDNTDEWFYMERAVDPGTETTLYVGIMLILNCNDEPLMFGMDDLNVSYDAPEIQVTPTAFNFGNVGVGYSASLPFSVQNTGSLPLTYNCSIEAPLSFINTDGASAQSIGGTLGAGASAGYQLVYTPVNTAPAPDFYIFSNDPEESVTLVRPNGNATLPATVLANALQLDGVDDYAATASSVSYYTNAATIEMWFRADLDSPHIQFLTSMGMEQLEIHTDYSVGSLRFIPTTGVYLDTPTGSIARDVWTHVACVYAPDAGVVKVYINGEDMALANHGYNPATTPLSATPNPVYLGIRGSSLGYPLHGSVDEVRCWNVARSADDIRRNMHLLVNDETTGLLTQWHCGESDGSALIDYVSEKHMFLHNTAGSCRVAGTLPIGTGVSACYTTPAGGGALDCADTGLSFNYTSADAIPFVVTRLDGAPLNPPTGQNEVFDTYSWVFKYFGATPTGSMTVSVPEDLTVEDGYDPDCIILFSRAGNGNADFVNTAHAVSVDAAANSATCTSYIGSATDRQFMLARSYAPQYAVASFDTTSIAFPAVRLGSTSTAWLHIINTGNGALTWSATTQAPVALTGYSGTPVDSLYATQSPGSDFWLEVQFSPTTAGDFSGSFTFDTNDPVNGNVTVNWSGTALPVDDGQHCLAFTGYDYVSIPADSTFTGQSYTIEMWFMMENITGDARFLCAKGFESYEIHTGGTAFRFIPAPGVYMQAPVNTFEAGKWYHLACCYDPATAYVAVYVNGHALNVWNEGPNPLTTLPLQNNTPFYLGIRQNMIMPHNGGIDEVRVWEGVRTPQQIRLGMHNQPDVNDTALRGYWKLDEGQGSVVVDATMRHHGTLTNCEWEDSPVLLGANITHEYVVPTTPGDLDCPEVGLRFSFTSADSSATLYVTPFTPNAVDGYDETFAGSGRIVQYYGTVSPSCTLTQTIADNLTPFDAAWPGNIRLLARAEGSLGDYANLAGATAVDADLNSAQYENAAVWARQFLLARASAQQLAAPQNLRIAVSGGNVTLAWDAVPGASGYRVYAAASVDGAYTEDTTGTLNGTGWTAPLPAANTCYRVTATIESERK